MLWSKTEKDSQGCIICDMECMQETATYMPNYIFDMELSRDTSRDEKEGAERTTKEWDFKEDTCLIDFIQVLYGQKFWDYSFLSHNDKGYDDYFIASKVKNAFAINHPRW